MLAASYMLSYGLQLNVMQMYGRGQIISPRASDLPLVEDSQFQGLDPPLTTAIRALSKRMIVGRVSYRIFFVGRGSRSGRPHAH